MALSNSTVWDVRPGAGSDTNGGGYVTGGGGTDFSIQDSPQQTYTDLVAVTSTTISSVARAFSSVDVGNIINITSGTGWTTGRFQILSVAASVATMDRAIATASSTGGNGKLGGALAALTILAGLSIKIVAYLKGTLTITASLFLTPSDWSIEGYTTTHGDGGNATITHSADIGSNGIIYPANTGTWAHRNITFSSTASTRRPALAFIANANYVVFENCVFDGVSYAVDMQFSGSHSALHFWMRKCEIKNCTQNGLRLYQVNGGFIDDCYIHDNTSDGIKWLYAGAAGNLIIQNSTIKSNGATGIFTDGDQNGAQDNALHVINCNIINNTTDGIKAVGGGTNFPIIVDVQNSIIDSNGGYGINTSGALVAGLARLTGGGYNAFRSNTSGARNNFPVLTGDITLTGDPFTNRAGADFTLNATAGAGAACKGVGFPPTFP